MTDVSDYTQQKGNDKKIFLQLIYIHYFHFYCVEFCQGIRSDE